MVETQHRTVLVVGGGLAGAAAALALRGRDRSVEWLREATPPPSLPEGFDARVYAISPGNLAWLESLGVGRHLQRERVAPVASMEIRGAHGEPLELSARHAGVPAMANIVEAANLQQALEAAVGDACGAPGASRVTSLQAGDEQIEARLDDGSTRHAALVVAADGAGSVLREMAGIDTEGEAYGHRAVVANFACERPHRGIACQWFEDGAVLAWLPLPGDHISMVWSLPEARAQALLQMSPEALGEAVAAAGHRRWGDLRLVSTPRDFPLQRRRARQMVAPRFALVGDAAHVVHPLAGQGINLGFRDIRELVQVLHADPGEARFLRHYEALRQIDVRGIETLTDGLFRLFGSPLSGWLGGIGLGLLNHFPPIKSHLVHQALR